MFELLTAYKAKFYAHCSVVLLLLSIISGQAGLSLMGVFTAILLLFVWTNRGIRVNIIDVVIIMLLIYEIILGNSQYGKNNSLIPILTQCIFTTFYFIVRLSMRERDTVKVMLKWSSIFFIIASLFCVVSFLMFREKVLSAGFDVLSDFKFLYRPFGNLNNVWATFLLCFWLIYLLYTLFYGARNRLSWWWFASFSLLYCLIVSFSRGIYICMGIVFVGLLISLLFSRKFNTKFKIGSITVVLLSLSALALLHKKEFIQTARITETVSQQRSLENRVSSLSYIEPLLQEIPVCGVGTGNYSMAMDKYLYQDDNNSYTNFAPNIVSQLLIEKGIVGAVLWGLLIVVVCVSFRRTDAKLRKEQLFILFTLTVIFLRELSFPSLLTTLGLQLMLALILGIYANNLVESQGEAKPHKIIYTALILSVFVYCSVLNGRYTTHKANILQFKESLEKGFYDEAEIYIAKCRHTVPTFVYHAALHKKRYLTTSDTREIEKACDCLTEAISANPFDIRLKYDYAMTLYLAGQTHQATSMLKELSDSFPQNSLMHATIGNIFYNDGDKDSAIPHFVKAVELSPFILETEAWQKFSAADSLSCALIINAIESGLQKTIEDPIKFAKLGKIMYLFGRYDIAEKLLHKALAALPNLQSPRVCLWRMALLNGGNNADTYLRRAKFLGFDEQQKVRQEQGSRLFNDGSLLTTADFFANYEMKFQCWYATEWYPEIMIFQTC